MKVFTKIKYIDGINSKLPGIYKIVNKLDLKFYLGSTGGKGGLKGRLYTHLNQLRNNKHGNPYLQHAFNKYGEESFEFIGILNTEKGENYDVEQYLLNFLKPYRKEIGYNINSNANKENHFNKIGNNRGSNRFKKRLFLNPNNEIVEVTDLIKFCESNGFNLSSFRCLSIGTINSCCGWRLYKGEIPKDKAKIIVKKYSYDLVDLEGNRYTGNNYMDFCRKHNLKRRKMLNLIKGLMPSCYGYVNYKDYLNGVRRGKGKTGKSKEFDVIDPKGKRHVGINAQQFCKENGLNESLIYDLKRGKSKTYKGWRLTPAELKV